MANPTEEVIAALRDLHPQNQSPIPTTPPPVHEEFEVEPEAILAALKSFPRDSSAGPSGIRPNHIVEALRCRASGPSSDLLENLGRLTTMAANGLLPQSLAPLLAAERLLPF